MTRSFHLSSLYAPAGWSPSWSEAACLFVRAQDDPALLRGFVNTVLGETWEEPGEAPPDSEKLMARRESYRLGQVPDGVLFLTAGVDVQKSWLEGYVYGWGRGRQRWVIDRWRIEHSPFEDAAWDELTGKLNQVYRRQSGGAEMSIVRMVIDTGFVSNEVYIWARQQGSGRVMAAKGSGHHLPAIVTSPSQVDITVSGRRIKRGCKLWMVDVSACKSELYGLLGKERPAEGEPYPAGWVHFASDLDEEFFKQLTAESLQSHIVKGYRKTEWVKNRERNEALDCANLARAGAFVFGLDRHATDERWWSSLGERMRSAMPAKPVLDAPPVVASMEGPPKPWVEDRGGGWFGGRTKDWLRR
jgi:phage terminase large subunit GpA-like protein